MIAHSIPVKSEDSACDRKLFNPKKGRPIKGTKMCIPESFKVSLVKMNIDVENPEDKKVTVSKNIDDIILWNLSKQPSLVDPYMKSMIWPVLSQKLHDII